MAIFREVEPKFQHFESTHLGKFHITYEMSLNLKMIITGSGSVLRNSRFRLIPKTASLVANSTTDQTAHIGDSSGTQTYYYGEVHFRNLMFLRIQVQGHCCITLVGPRR
jgi:hypothetical protein